MKIFYSETHRQHDPSFELYDGGRRVPYLENPDRMDKILKALSGVDWTEIIEPSDFGLDPIYAVHDVDYINFLASAWTEWLALKSESDSAAEKLVFLPVTFPTRGQMQIPKSLYGRAGYYMTDLSACIVKGTYQAALTSANCALSAAKSVVGDQGSAFALCRPPGHHAGIDFAGGYCFINNAAVAANWLSATGRVAELDIDYHCGNGTQDIFYSRDDVLTISIHADPDFEYPHYNGFAKERGKGRGFGFHHNFPLPAGTNDAAYLETLEKVLQLIREYDPKALVVSAGMDIYADDPLGTIKVTTDGIAKIAKQISALQLPTVIVMEGGYNNDALGRNIVAFLSAFV